MPVSKDSEFDAVLQSGFACAVARGDILRTKPESIQRRHLSGTLGLVAQFSKEHFGKKRARDLSLRQVLVDQADSQAFNFTKVSPAEKIAEIEALPLEGGGGGLTTALANVSPLTNCHVLLVPNCDQVLPQVLTEHHVLCGLHLLRKSTRRDFRLMFNSAMAYSSVNHFHWHGIYLAGCGFSEDKLPIERAERSVVSGGLTEGRGSIELLVESRWYTRGFVCAAGCRKGTAADVGSPPADLEALASLSARVVAELQRRNIPHSVMLAPPVDRKRRIMSSSALAHEEESKPIASSPEVYIIPRRPEGELREDAGFYGAVAEICGLIITNSTEAFGALTEDSVREVFRGDVSLPEGEFDKLICKVAWLPE